MTINDAAGEKVVLGAGDVIRLKIGVLGSTPLLDLDSAAPSGNGSSVSFANPSSVRIDQKDLTFREGIYDVEVGMVDDDDGDALKHVEEGVFALHGTMTGDVGIT